MKMFFVRGLVALTMLVGVVSVAASQTLNLNGGLVVGGGEFEVSGVANAGGFTVGTGNVAERSSFSDTATMTTGRLTVDSNHNRTNFGFEGESFAGAAAQNTIKTTGVNAGSSGSFSAAGVTGGMNYAGAGLNVTGNIALP